MEGSGQAAWKSLRSVCPASPLSQLQYCIADKAARKGEEFHDRAMLVVPDVPAPFQIPESVSSIWLQPLTPASDASESFR